MAERPHEEERQRRRNLPASAGDAILRTHQDLLDRKLLYQQYEQALLEQQEDLWNQRRAIMEEETTKENEDVDRAVQQVDAYRARTSEQISWIAKAMERNTHALERVEDIERKSQEEGRKLGYDWFKHLTTLGTGSILILAALMNSILSNADATGLIRVTFICFFLSVVGSLVYMYLISLLFLTSTSSTSAEEEEQRTRTKVEQLLKQQGKTPEHVSQHIKEKGKYYASWVNRLAQYIGYVAVATLILFSLGILSLLIFAWINL